MTAACRKPGTGLTGGKARTRSGMISYGSSPMVHLDYIAQPERDRHYEYMKSKVRCKGEYMFAVIKGKFGYRKADTAD